jgi:hypothetical protein
VPDLRSPMAAVWNLMSLEGTDFLHNLRLIRHRPLRTLSDSCCVVVEPPTVTSTGVPRPRSLASLGGSRRDRQGHYGIDGLLLPRIHNNPQHNISPNEPRSAEQIWRVRVGGFSRFSTIFGVGDTTPVRRTSREFNTHDSLPSLSTSSGAGRTDRGRSLAVKTERKPYLVRLKPKCADAYAGKLQVGREYQALFSLENARYMSIVGTDVTHALKAHFDIRPT